MSPSPKKLLAVLLALIVAFIPMGGAWAASHACEDGSGDVAATDHAQHLGGAMGADRDTADSGYPGGCLSCSGDCCASGTCPAGTCGASVALVSVSGAQINLADEAFHADLSHSAITRRQIPPIRPPRV